MEKAERTFEEQWRQALDKAEVEPPQQVWVAIDGQLANEQVAGYRKEAYFYKRLAAACLLLFAIGGAYYWFNGQSDVRAIAEVTKEEGITVASDQASRSELVAIADDEERAEQVEASASVPNIQSKVTVNNSTSSLRATSNQAISSPGETVAPSKESSIETSQLIALEAKNTSFPSQVSPWKSDHLYGVARTWEEVSKDKIVSPMWAGVSFSAGAFDPGFGGNSGNDLVFASQEDFNSLSAAQPTQDQQSPVYTAGQSVAGGINIGKKMSERIMLSGGLHYSSFNTGSATSQLASDGLDNTFALTNETSDASLENALNQGALRYDGRQVQLSNEFQYLTIPIKAGYVLLDKKFNITVNTGLSSNIRMNSKLVASGESEELSNDFSTSDSYESVYFNFLTSVEFGYIFKNHYQFMLEPNYNQALTDFTSSGNPNKAKPKNIGVSIGFRYNF